ncbi:MAG: FAD-dependent oxidoreductase [Treponemataceae bacterium]|nr:FAD-dependent oxidoreductase [Treponemataceae bacterium]
MATAAPYVIIGNSTAAIGCIEGIRTLDKENPIIVISDEQYAAYSRPLISYLLEKRTDERHMMLRGRHFYKENNVTFMPGRTAAAIDAANKIVRLADGEEVAYGKLLNATGSRPFVPPMAGLDDMPQYFTFLSLDSAKAVEKAITRKSRVLIIGAGLVGMKCAEGIAERVGSVTVVEMAPRVLPAALLEDGSALIQKQMEAHNCTFLLGDSIARFTPNYPKGTAPDGEKPPLGGTAHSNNGADIEFDVLICAVGVRPNTQLVEGAGGAVDKGIVIDENCRTTLPDVWAAGDCTLSYDLTADASRILAMLPNAYFQGECAGINMAGGEKPFTKAMPLNSAGFFGLHMATAGSYTGDCIDASRPAVKAKGFLPAQSAQYRKFFVKDDLLKGFIIIGDISRSGIYTSMIREQIPVSSVDFDAIKEEPRLIAFSKSRREAILSAKEEPAEATVSF